jgi:exodeoxyribonuclease VII small subunit
MTKQASTGSKADGAGGGRTFEDSLRELETIVRQLESGELALERSLDLFEQGIVLARFCQTQLETAERRVEVLLQEKGGAIRRTSLQEEAPPTSRHDEGFLEDDEELEEEDEEEGEEDSDLPF